MMTLKVGQKLISLEKPLVMGVINITPDSFYESSRIDSESPFLRRVETMINEGVDIIDLGAFSSRPGAQMISVQEEIDRLMPFVELLSKNFPEMVLSLDSYRSEVLKEMAKHRAFIVNDITGFEQDPGIVDLAVEYDLPYILMHMKGMPENMQDNPSYENVSDELLNYFAHKLDYLHKKGLHQVLIDPGFGFGKTIEHNYKLLSSLSAFRIFEKPIMVGLSRKSMIYKYLGITADGALNGTTALHMVALQNGARILRVHDVKEAVQTVNLYMALQKAVNN